MFDENVKSYCKVIYSIEGHYITRQILYVFVEQHIWVFGY